MRLPLAISKKLPSKNQVKKVGNVRTEEVKAADLGEKVLLQGRDIWDDVFIMRRDDELR